MKHECNQAKETRMTKRRSSFPTRWYSSVGLVLDSEALKQVPARKYNKTKKIKSENKKKQEIKHLMKLKPIKITPVDEAEFKVPMNVMKASVISTKHDILKNWNVKKNGSFKYYEEKKAKEENQEKSKPPITKEKKIKKGATQGSKK